MGYNFTYETRFVAVNTMTPAINEATQSIEMLNLKLSQTRNTAVLAAQDFRGLNTSISTGLMRDLPKVEVATVSINRQLTSMRGALFGVQMGLFYVSMLTSNMMMLESATNNVEGAHERLNKVVREGGRGTEQYRSAVRQLENAQINLNRTQASVNIMTVAMGLQTVSMGISFAQAIPAIRDMINTLKSYATIQAISQALQPGMGWVKLAAGIAIGAGATYAITQMTQPAKSPANVNVELTTNSPYDAFMRQNRNATIQSGVG